jgi:glycogen(starch) synthase
MRIALLPSSYPPALGGVEELTRHLALSLGDAGDQVEVWTLQPDDSARETVEILDGIVVRRFPMPLPARNWSAIRRSAVTGPRTLFSLQSAVAAFRPDVLHVQCFGPNGAYATALSRLTGLPLVVTLQGETLMDDTDIFDISRSLQSSLRAGLRRAAVVTGCSSFTLADAEERFGLMPGRGRVVYNGVDLDGGWYSRHASAPFAPVAEDPDRPYILALGRIVEKKGFDLLLAAYAAIDDRSRGADLVIAGSGAALDGLRHIAVELGIDGHVHFVGRLNRDEVADAMAGAALFVMPSRLEPFGIVILEAWRAGIAVVASNRGGAPEFLRDGHDGVLVDPFDTASFGATLEALLADPERRRVIAEAGRARVEEFGWSIVAEEYRRIYMSATGTVAGDSDSPDGTAHSQKGESVR